MPDFELLFTMAVWTAAAAVFVEIFCPSFAEIFTPKEGTLINTTTTTMNAARPTYSNNDKNNKKKKMTAKTTMKKKFEQPRSNDSDWLLNMRTTLNNTTPHNNKTTEMGKSRLTWVEKITCYFDKEENSTECGPAQRKKSTDKSIIKSDPGRKISVNEKATADLEFGMKVMIRMEHLIPTTLDSMLAFGGNDWRARHDYNRLGKRTKDQWDLERQGRRLAANKMEFLEALDKELDAYSDFGLVGPILSVAQRVGVLDKVKVPRGRTEPMNERKHARTETTIQIRKVRDVEPSAKRRRISLTRKLCVEEPTFVVGSLCAEKPKFAIGSRSGSEAKKEQRRQVERARLRRRR